MKLPHRCRQATGWSVGLPKVMHLTQNGALLRGGRLSHSELKSPIDQRLSDREWQRRLIHSSVAEAMSKPFKYNTRRHQLGERNAPP